MLRIDRERWNNLPPEERELRTHALEEYFDLLGRPELVPVRVAACESLSNLLAGCGERLWAFGHHGGGFRKAVSIVLQIGGSVSKGAVALGVSNNMWAAHGLVRPLVECEYLVKLFLTDPTEADKWLNASAAEHWKQYQPSAMRKRMPQFRHGEYQAHCDAGVHPTPTNQDLLPAFIAEENAYHIRYSFWLDLAIHLRRIWRDISDIANQHQSIEVALQYLSEVEQALSTWADTDPANETDGLQNVLTF